MSNVTVQLRELLDRWTQPCLDDCQHSQCPLLRELWTIIEDARINSVLVKAGQTVKPIVDKEREGENIGDLMSMRLDTAASTEAHQHVYKEVEGQSVPQCDCGAVRNYETTAPPDFAEQARQLVDKWGRFLHTTTHDVAYDNLIQGIASALAEAATQARVDERKLIYQQLERDRETE